MISSCLSQIDTFAADSAKFKEAYYHAKSCDNLVTQNTFMIYLYNVNWNKDKVNLVGKHKQIVPVL